MAIEKSRLSLDTATETRSDPIVAISTTEPPSTYLARSEDSATVFTPVSQREREEGQIAFVVNPTSGQCAMRCVVKINGQLTWVPVSFGEPSSKYVPGSYKAKLGNIGLS